MLDYGKARSKRTERLHHSSTMRGGKLMPVACVPFKPSESGILSQEFLVEMEPIAGRLVSDILVECVAVYVPALAVDAVLNTDPLAAGNTEIFRQRLEDGDLIFPLEDESEITKRMGIEPMKIGGVPKTLSVARVAHNVAVNFLRKRKYVYANGVDTTNAAVTPALLSSTALDRFNAVLDPEDRVNGAVQLVGKVPVRGIGLGNGGISPNFADSPVGYEFMESDGIRNYQRYAVISDQTPLGSDQARVHIEENPDFPGRPNIHLNFSEAQSLSLKDFYVAERQDRIVRHFRSVIEANPEYGEQIVSRMVHGLDLDTGKMPYVLYEQTIALGASTRLATDGASLDVSQTNTAGAIGFSRVVPRNEFGGVVITFLSVKPEEVVTGQPHPVLSEPWAVHNHAADELAIDPVPITRKQLDSSVPDANADDVMFYQGNNHIYRDYNRFDWSRDVDTSTVDHRSARWRYKVPISVDADSIVYPEDIDHYPFVLNAPTDPAASYVVKSLAQIASPAILGPTPLEKVDIVETENLFEEEEV